MFERGVNELTHGMALWCVLLYVIVLIFGINTYKQWPQYKYSKASRDVFLLLYFILFAVTYTVDADFWGYKSVVVDTNYSVYSSYESIYYDIISFVNHNYLYFRIIIWGAAVCLVYLTSKLSQNSPFLVLIILFLLWGNSFSYARASLAFSIYYLGLILLLNSFEKKKTKKIILLIISILIMLSSFAFHRSMGILIALTPFVFAKLGKQTVFFFLFLFVVVLIFSDFIISQLLISAELDDNVSHRVNEVYSESEFNYGNWKGVVGLFFHYGLYVICIFYLLRAVYKQKDKVMGREQKLLIYLVVLVVVSTLSLVLFNDNTIYMHRFLKMTVIPFSLLIVYFYKKNILTPKEMYFILVFSAFGQLWGYGKFIIG